MDRETASFIVRMHEALVDEGIGPVGAGTPDVDKEILQSAARVAIAYGDLAIHLAWDIMLITDEHHQKYCTCQ